MNFRIPSLVAVAIWAGFTVYVISYVADAYSETIHGMPDVQKDKGKRQVAGMVQRAKQAIREGDVTGGVPQLKPLDQLP